MKLGIGLAGGLAEVAATARRAEAAGFESAWVAELDRSAVGLAAAAIGATSRISVGTGVALAFPRSPTIMAMEAWDLDELSGGRFRLGLGSQVRRVMEARFSVPFDHPAERMAEYATAVRTVWAAGRGEPVIHEGRFYRITMPTFHGEPRPERPDVPILLAAVGPVMASAAGRVADGLLGHPIASPRYLAAVVVPARDAGATAAGRQPGECPISAGPIVALDADPDAARRDARLQVAFYATTPSYRGILAVHDRAAIGPLLRRAFVRRDHDAMAALIDDELLDAVAIAGRPDEARDRLRGWAGIADRVVLAAPWWSVPAGRRRALADAIIDVFGPEGAPTAT